MKTQKMSLANIQGKLSRAEMKNVMAGSSPCQAKWEDCDSVTHLNCCSGLVCATKKCQTPTAPQP